MDFYKQQKRRPFPWFQEHHLPPPPLKQWTSYLQVLLLLPGPVLSRVCERPAPPGVSGRLSVCLLCV